MPIKFKVIERIGTVSGADIRAVLYAAGRCYGKFACRWAGSAPWRTGKLSRKP